MLNHINKLFFYKKINVIFDIKNYIFVNKILIFISGKLKDIQINNQYKILECLK